MNLRNIPHVATWSLVLTLMFSIGCSNGSESAAPEKPSASSTTPAKNDTPPTPSDSDPAQPSNVASADKTPTPTTTADKTTKPEEPAPPPPPLTEYKGRRIAQTMSYHGAGWLTRNNREEEERASKLIEILKLKPGQTVCDLGCGNGYHTLKMARLVAPDGRVLAVDIQQEMLDMLAKRAKAANVANVKPILGKLHDPNLPDASVDLILLVDVYHEFSHPEHMLKAMRKSLKPTGRVVLVEYREEDPQVPIKPLHKMSKAQILKEFPPNGFKLVDQYDELPWQHVMIFQRDDAPSSDSSSDNKNPAE